MASYLSYKDIVTYDLPYANNSCSIFVFGISSFIMEACPTRFYVEIGVILCYFTTVNDS